MADCDGINDFIEALDAKVDFSSLQKNARGELVAYGGKAWKQVVRTCTVGLLSTVVPLSTRMALWRKHIRAALVHAEDIIAVTSYLIACEAMDKIVSTKVTEVMPASETSVAVPNKAAGEPTTRYDAIRGPHITIIAPRREDGLAESAWMTSVSGAAAQHFISPIEQVELRHIGGWVVKKLRALQTIFSKASTNQEAKALINKLEASVGTHLSDDEYLAPQQRLTVSVMPVSNFLMQLEWWLRTYVLTPQRLMEFGEDHPRWAFMMLSSSPFVRTLWGAALAELNITASSIVIVGVLERFVRIYMRSRMKTLRVNAGLVPESSANSAIRNKLKTFSHAQAQQAAAKLTTDDVMLLAVTVASYEPKVTRSGFCTIKIGLVDNSHGISFEEVAGPSTTGATWRVAKLTTPKVSKNILKRSYVGVVKVGDVVVATERLRDGKKRTVSSKCEVDLNDVQAGGFPLILTLERAIM